MNNPINNLTGKEWGLWLGSLLVVIVSNVLSGDIDLLTLLAACVGITSLIFAAKGNVWAQILMIVFSVLYGIISWRFHYWGEMIPYLGMTIQKLSSRHIMGLGLFGTLTTLIFYMILRMLETPNIVFSTISITTSFLAASLTMLRTSYYALGYALNDIVLIVLWLLASIENPAYIPVAVNFAIFFLNDMYGFISWRKREINYIYEEKQL